MGFQTELQIASLTTDISHKILFQAINGSTPKESSLAIGYLYILNGANNGSDLEQFPRHMKAILKGTQVAHNASKIIGHLGAGKDVSMTITSTGLVGGPPVAGHALNVEGITFFLKTVFFFPANDSRMCDFQSTQYLHFSSPTTRIISQPNINNALDLCGKRAVALTSGVCLFNMRLVKASAGEGFLDLRELRTVGPTLYELEYIARSGTAIADLASLVYGGQKDCDASDAPSRATLRLCLDVPSFHYYQSVHNLLCTRACTYSDALEWLTVMERRHQQISYVYRGYIRHELSRRSFSGKVCNFDVSPGTHLVCRTIRQCLIRNVLPNLDEVLQILNEAEPVWHRFWNLLPDKERPGDFRELGYLFYVFQVLRPALLDNFPATVNQHNVHRTTMGPSARLLIGIDDGTERRIYSRAQKILKKIRSSPNTSLTSDLLEVYLPRRVFIGNNTTGSNLYLADPTPATITMQGVDPDIGLRIATYSKRQTNSAPLRLIAKLYGSDAADVLGELCEAAGLVRSVAS